jgi:glycerophosphoryl diester phosphodiesterase
MLNFRIPLRVCGKLIGDYIKYLVPIIMISFNSLSQEINWQGHRGCRGLMPENSLPAFEKALELGVTTLEIDVVISKDKQVIVSHDPWISPVFCLDKEGDKLKGIAEDMPNLFDLTYDEIISYDCGSSGNPNFPEQKKIKVHKPKLIEVFQLAEKYCKDHRRNEVYYNIEIKSDPKWDGDYHPDYWDFCDLVFNTIDAYVPWKRVNIQSFDHRILQYFHQMYPGVRLAVLEEFNQEPERVIEALGFFPEIYSPYYKLLKKKKINWLHENKVQVIVWTVNSVDEMREMIKLGADGIITDYPNLIMEVVGSH